jgi:heme-binding protein
MAETVCRSEMTMPRWFKKTLIASIVVFVAIQFVRPSHSNPPVDAQQTLAAHIGDAQAIMPVIDRACGDCHSNETRWPWYSNVAPVSWLIAREVQAGRAALNFSSWGTYSVEQQRKLLKESCEEVREGEMPIFTYTLLHTEAKLVPTDVQAICDRGQVARP